MFKIPFLTRRPTPAVPPSRFDRVVELLLWLAAAIVIASWIAPGLLGVLVKSTARTFGLMLVFLLLARALSARIRQIFGGSR